jgi:hypothetical protein
MAGFEGGLRMLRDLAIEMRTQLERRATVELVAWNGPDSKG